MSTEFLDSMIGLKVKRDLATGYFARRQSYQREDLLSARLPRLVYCSAAPYRRDRCRVLWQDITVYGKWNMAAWYLCYTPVLETKTQHVILALYYLEVCVRGCQRYLNIQPFFLHREVRRVLKTSSTSATHFFKPV